MPLYVGDYLADTRRLSTLEHGSYLLLIMDYWQNGSLPITDAALARIAGLSDKEWARAKWAIEPLFQPGWRHKRIDAELARAEEKSKAARASAEASWQSEKRGGRRSERNTDAYANAHRAYSGINGKTSENHSLPEGQNKGSNSVTETTKPLILLGAVTADAVRRQCEGISEQDAHARVSQSQSLSPVRESTSSTIEDNDKLSGPKRVRTRHKYSDEFEKFWQAYPTDANMGKLEAWQEWIRLAADDQTAAIASCPKFRAYCASRKDYRPVHANRYLAKRRFDGHAAVGAGSDARTFVKIGTAQWDAWDAWYRRNKKLAAPVNREGTGYWFATEWPNSESATTQGFVK